MDKAAVSDGVSNGDDAGNVPGRTATSLKSDVQTRSAPVVAENDWVQRRSVALLPAAYAADTVESLEMVYGRERPWIYWLLLTVIFSGLAALPFVSVEVGVTLPGVVRPIEDEIPIAASAGGTVGNVGVHDNETVRKGEALFAVSNPSRDKRLAFLAKRIPQIDREAMGWSHVISLAGQLTTGQPAAIPHFGKVYEDYGDAHQSWLQLLGDWQQLAVDLRAAKVEYKRMEQLVSEGFVTGQQRDERRHDWEAVKAQMGSAVLRYQATWRDRVQQLQEQNEQLSDEEQQLKAEAAADVVRSPADGVIVDAGKLIAGAVVSPAQVVANVSPDRGLIVETLVPSVDISRVGVGQAVRVSIDALPFSDWGTVPGRVEAVSADVAAGYQFPVLKMKVRLEKTGLQNSRGGVASIRKGMTAEVRCFTGRRSLWSLLIQNVDQTFNPARYTGGQTASGAGALPKTGQ